MGESTKIGIWPAKLARPNNAGEPVSRWTSQDCATDCIQVPMSEISWPAKKSWKFRCRRALRVFDPNDRSIFNLILSVAFRGTFRHDEKFSTLFHKKRMLVRVLYHDHCFDGAASAAFFSRFFRSAFHPDAGFEYTGMAHRASQIFEDSLFDGDENAIVDFKYSSNPKLTWWFDHHQSAFLSPADARHFERNPSPRKMFDISYKSCTSYIRD